MNLRGQRFCFSILVLILATFTPVSLIVPGARAATAESKMMTMDNSNPAAREINELKVKRALENKIVANNVLRGMRTVSDFEYELQMALANKSLSQELETVFMVTDSEFSHVSSSVIREVVSLGGSARKMVPAIVEKRLKEKLLKR